MYSNVFIFGDSFMAGDELASALIPDLAEKLALQFPKEKIEFLKSGELISNNIKKITDILEFIDSYTNEYHCNNADSVCRNSTFGNILASKLGIPAHNFASGGASHVRILDSIITNLDKIQLAVKPLILIGLTGVKRTSRFMKNFEYGSTNTNIHTILMSYDNPWDTGGYKRRMQEYKMLDIEFGDDPLSNIYNKTAFTLSYKQILQGFDIIVFDNLGDITDTEKYYEWYCSHNHYDDLTPNDFRIEQARTIRNILLDDISKLSLSIIAREEYNTSGKKSSCFFGHPRPECHNIIADKLYDQITNSEQ